MRLFLSSLAVVAVILGVSAQAGEINSTDVSKQTPAKDLKFGFLERWENHFPNGGTYGSNEVLPPPSAIWDHPKVKPMLLKTLGEQRLKLLMSGWGAAKYSPSLVGRFNDVVAFSSCKLEQGNCVDRMAEIYINMKDGSVQACWEDETGDAWLRSDSGPSQSLIKGYCNPDNFEVDTPIKMYRERNKDD